MSEDGKPAKSNSSPSSSSQPNNDDGILSSVRRFADERISAALHSVFGIPSILQTPSNSNWIREDLDRTRFENMNRRDDSTDEPRTNNNRDDESGNNNSRGNNSGSGISGFGGGAGSSGNNGPTPPSDVPSSNRDSNDENNRPRLPSSLMPPAVLIPEFLLALGVHSADLLDRFFSTHVKELERLINEESEQQKAITLSKFQENLGPFQREFQRLLDLEAMITKGTGNKTETAHPNSEMVVIKGTQTNDEPPQFTVTRHPGKPYTGQSSILRELFGEDMYGSQRTYPLFTSFFDEFLPDGNYNKRPEEQPPTTVGGWKSPFEASISQLTSTPMDPFGQFFKVMMRPWIQKINENSEVAPFDVRARVIDRINNEIWNDVREDSPSLEEFNKMMQEERAKITQERMRRLVEKRQELDKLMKERGITEPQIDKRLPRMFPNNASGILDPVEKREPETEFDLHDFMASVTPRNNGDNGKYVVSQSFSSISTTGADGITRVKKVRERRYSDGTVEREEHNEENPNVQTQQLDPFAGHIRILEEMKRRREAQNGNIRRAIEAKKDTQDKKSETHNVQPSPPETKRDGDEKNGGWGSWMWADNSKKD
ncbi:hypothetical protein AA313_de0206993 [Arthrobotrys entomopaga]|nr:hypothetical protein AA313_de0206993 [Arthrobotrys entomopaga]